VDVAAFLARVPPFDTIEPDALERAARGVRIEFFPAGTTVLRQGGEPARWLYLVRRGEMELLVDDRLVDVLGEGETFGELSLLTGLGPTASVKAREDTLCYLVDEAATRATLGSPAGLTFTHANLRRRMLKRDASAPVDRRLVRVGSLVRRPPVTTDRHVAVRDAAALMARERVSCLLVPEADGVGILTDRDLRSRVLAEGRGGETPVGDVMTFPAAVVDDGTTAGEVLLAMLEGGHHHFPVVDPAGRLVGVVTDTDLIGLEGQSPFALKSRISRAGTVEEVAGAGRQVPDVVGSLVDGSADPVDVGYCVALLTDALTVRLIELAERDLGPSPARWAWLAMGSQARREQALRTDQDHAIAIEDGSADEEWFATLGERVTTGLEAAGIARCNGDVMAANPAMRRTLGHWTAAYRGWIADPGLQGSILSSIAFDYRRVAGALPIEPALDAVIAEAKDHPMFLRHLSRRALDLRPPTGFLRDFVVEARGEHAGKLDLKHGGLVIIGELARAWGVAVGSSARGTIARLDAAAAAGRIDEETRSGLGESFRLLWELRLREHVRAHRGGEPPEDFVEPAQLGELTRRELKEAFRIIAGAQRQLATELGVHRR
jgi:CBS domain-containing protein